MDIRLRQIVSKAAGIYFIVTDNSQVNAIEEESRLRLFFINAPKGPVNCLVKFAKGDTTSFTTIFGKANRSKEKKGDFGHKVCLDALSAGPIAVVNLRVFDDERDTTQVASINPNTCFVSGVKSDKVPYASLFNKNGYWTPDRDILTEKYYQTDGFLNFGNIGNNDISVFVVKAKENEVSILTEEYDKTLEECSLEIDDYPNLDFNTRLYDTFVKVYVFNNTFENAHINATYGHLFNENDQITQTNLELLTQIGGVGFVGSYVGSVIPSLISEKGDNLSIDDIMYSNFVYTGILCDINNELLEVKLSKDFSMVDLFGFNSMIEDTTFTPVKNLMSYIDNTLVYDSDDIIPSVPSSLDDNHIFPCKDALKYGIETGYTLNTFTTNANTGIRYDDLIIGEDRLLHITDIQLGEVVTENKDYKIFGETNSPSNANIVDTQSGILYNINSKKWETSTDGKNWTIIDQDFFTTPSGKSLVYVNKYNNAVGYGSAVYAVAYCQEEACNYVVRYQSGQVSMFKLNGMGDANVNIINNGNIFVVYGTLGTYFSTDGENWYVSGSNVAYATSGFGTTYRFIGYVEPSGFGPGFNSDSFGAPDNSQDYYLIYSSDGQNWHEIESDYYGSIADLSISENSDLVLFDSDNAYILTASNVYYIAKNDLGDETKQWSNVALTLGTSDAYRPAVVKETATTTFIALSSYSGENKVITITKETHAMAIDDIDVTASGMLFAKVNKLAYFLDIDNSDLDKFFLVSDITSESATEVGTFSMPYVLEYQLATYTVDGKLLVGTENSTPYVIKAIPYVNKPEAVLKNNVIQSYKLSEYQFIDGTPSRQEEILNMIIDPSIRKGLKNTAGLRYIIDTFKSYVEPDYKRQFSELVIDLHENNRFVTCIMAEPFMTDIRKSTNPLFKDTPSSDVVNYEYFATGGNKQYSTKLLSKVDNQFLFFFGPGDVENGVVKPLTGLISNLFYSKQQQFDIVANTTGYIQGINQLEDQIDDNDRKYLEKFRYNPIIDFGGYTIFGNLSAQKAISKQQQIHNVELLCYIKEQLYNMSKGGVFKKGTYDEYLATQIECQNFMDSLTLANAIEPGAIVKCDLENNTQEIRNYKIKLIHVEYTPYDCIEKIVFDLNINK